MEFLAIIDQYLGLFREAVMAALGPIEEVGGDILRSLIFISIVFAAGAIAFASHSLEGMMSKVWRWVITLAVICLIGSNMGFIITNSLEGMLGIGASAGGFSSADFLAVSGIMRAGYEILDPLNTHIQMLCTGPWSCAVNWNNSIKYEIAWYTIFISFLIMCFQMVAAQIQFMVHGVSTLMVIGLAAIPQTSWAAERAIGGFVANMMHLFVLSLIMGIGFQIFDLINITEAVTVNQATMAAIAGIFQAIMAWNAKSISDGIVNGGPSLAGSAVAGAIGAAMTAAVGGTRLATSRGMRNAVDAAGSALQAVGMGRGTPAAAASGAEAQGAASAFSGPASAPNPAASAATGAIPGSTAASGPTTSSGPASGPSGMRTTTSVGRPGSSVPGVMGSLPQSIQSSIGAIRQHGVAGLAVQGAQRAYSSVRRPSRP